MGLFDIIRSHFSGRSGGWKLLAERYPASGPAAGQVLTRQTIQVGAVLYRNCVTLGVRANGLFIEGHSFFIRGTPVEIPWEAVAGVDEGRLYWQKAYLLQIGRPHVATLTLQGRVYELVKPHLSEFAFE